VDRRVDEAVNTGRPVVIDDAAITLRNDLNARCEAEHGSESRIVTLEMLRHRGQLLVERVRALSEAQLDAPMMEAMGQAREGRVVAGMGTLRHAVVISRASVRHWRRPRWPESNS